MLVMLSFFELLFKSIVQQKTIYKVDVLTQKNSWL